jgi:hypothetical protein
MTSRVYEEPGSALSTKKTVEGREKLPARRHYASRNGWMGATYVEDSALNGRGMTRRALGAAYSHRRTEAL